MADWEFGYGDDCSFQIGDNGITDKESREMKVRSEHTPFVVTVVILPP
jgi:hypothetical protein